MSFTKAEKIIRKLQQERYEAFIVGGVVRDRLLGKSLGDIDIATSALPEDVQRIFPKTIPVGVEHGTVIVRMEGESFEVTTFRKEGEYEDYRHPSKVEFHDSIEVDLSRRDFTINAMALKQDGTVIDPFCGQADLDKGLIRAVGIPDERFREDPLRMMRALRFQSILGFQLEEKTYSALERNAHLLEKISVERIRDEFEKLLSGRHCEQSLAFIQATDIDQCLPRGPFQFDTDIEAYEWNVLETQEERWAAFILRIDTENPYEWLHEWKLPNQKRKWISQLVDLIRTDPDFTCKITLYQNGLDAMKSAMQVKRFLGEAVNSIQKELEELYAQLPIQNRAELKIDGNELQKLIERPAGRWIAELIQGIEYRVVMGTLKNEPSEIKEWIIECSQPLEND